MTFEHVATCIYLGSLEKRGFKMWRGIQNKKRALTTLLHSVKSKARKKKLYQRNMDCYIPIQ